MLDKESSLSQYAALVLAKTGWEKGVVGIAASHLVEDFNKPAILLNIDGDIASGSVRSVAGIDIIAAIRENARYLNAFGGHPMAAGLSLNVDQLSAFRNALSRSVQAAARGLPTEKQLQVDAYLPLANLQSALAHEIDRLAPFGSANPPPVLVTRGLEAETPIPFGKNNDHARLTVSDESGESRSVTWWNSQGQSLPAGKIDLAYYLRSGSYKGRPEITLEYLDSRESIAAPIEIGLPLYTSNFADYRLHPQAWQLAAEAASQSDTLLWGEGWSKKPELPTVDRNRIEKCSTLALLTAPARFSILQAILKQARPKRVLFSA
jgi:single-stranded-DNA-specific exonuclease